jgi:hypothetical protein
MQTLSLASLVVLAQLAGIANTDENYPTEEFSLPPQVSTVLERAGFPRVYLLSFHVNPYYLHADFNGDGKLDTALWIRENGSNKAGIAVLHGETDELIIVGAGKKFGPPEWNSDDLNGLDAWYVQLRGPVGQGVGEGPPPTLRGDAILAMKSESASGLIYWTGNDYRWYQQGD